MAAAVMGHRYHGTSDDRTRKLQIHSGRNRIFYQVDRGEASSQHSSNRAQKIFLAKHNMSLRVPKKILFDNAKQFDCHIFKDFCHQMGVEAAFISIYQPWKV
jgi:hypothetical protein